MQFAEATERGNATTIRNMLESGDLKPDIIVNREGFDKSPLSLACTYGQTSVVEELLKVGGFVCLSVESCIKVQQCLPGIFL